MRQKWLDACILPIILILLAVLLVHGAVLRDASFAAMQLAATAVIPTLFPFAVLSSFLTGSGLLHRLQGKLIHRLGSFYGIPACGVVAWVLGTVCGYPIGASVIAALYMNGYLLKDSAERMLPWCSNAGPAFVVVVAGETILGSAAAGWLLLAIHELSSLIVSLLFRSHTAADAAKSSMDQKETGSAVRIFTDSVRSAALTMVQISGFIVLFSAVSSLLSSFLPHNSLVSVLIRGSFELTSGLYALSSVTEPLRFPAAAFLLGWSGLCVHCQVLSLTLPHGLSAKPYLLGKLLQSIISLILAIPAANLIHSVPTAVLNRPSFSAFTVTAIWVLISTALFFTFLWKFRRSSAIMAEETKSRR